MGKASAFMKRTVNSLGDHPLLQKPFFWAGFFTVRLIYPVQYLLLRELISCRNVLDLGCGRHSMVPILPSKIDTTGVELFEPHLKEAITKGRHNRYIQGDVTKVGFPDKSFDAVVLLDVIEHLSKEEGAALMGRMERWARKKVVIFTPNGFLHQDEFDENPLMRHRSGWESDEFQKLGYKVYGVRGLRALKKKSFEEDHDHHGHDAIDGPSDLAQILTYHVPSWAFQLFCVKTLK